MRSKSELPVGRQGKGAASPVKRRRACAAVRVRPSAAVKAGCRSEKGGGAAVCGKMGGRQAAGSGACGR